MGGLVLHKGTVSHPLLGPAHVIEHAGRPITAMSAIDWDRPTQIPAIAEPRALPPGAGTLLINDIAERALRAGVQTLRYAGPYPTHALFASLLRSFRTTGTVETFTANVLDRAMRIAHDEVEVDFTPAPFTRTPRSYGYVDIRDDAADRVQIDRVVYDHQEQPSSLARLQAGRAIDSAPPPAPLRGLAKPSLAVDSAPPPAPLRGLAKPSLAILTVGVPIAQIAQLDAASQIVDGPHPIPAFQTAANGTAFPAALLAELAEAAMVFVPPPLASDVAERIRSRTVEWADLGWRATGNIQGGFAVHVGFLALAKDHMDLFAQRLSYHLASIAQSTVLDELMAARRRS